MNLNLVQAGLTNQSKSQLTDMASVTRGRERTSLAQLTDLCNVDYEPEKSLAGKSGWVVSVKCRISLMVANPLTRVMKRRRALHV